MMSMQIAVADGDQDDITWALTGLPAGAVLTPDPLVYGVATLDWTPQSSQIGEYNVTITATDTGAGGQVAAASTALAFGIPVGRVYSIVFGLGAGFAALAAVLIVPIQQAHYLMGADPLLLAFIVVIIGGLGSLPGTVVAAILIGLSDGIISVFFSPTLAKILATLLVALVLVFRPQGLFGARRS